MYLFIFTKSTCHSQLSSFIEWILELGYGILIQMHFKFLSMLWNHWRSLAAPSVVQGDRCTDNGVTSPPQGGGGQRQVICGQGRLMNCYCHPVSLQDQFCM